MVQRFGVGQKRVWGHLAAIVTMIFWGSTFAVTKTALEAGVSPLEMLIARFLLAWLMLQFIPCKKLGFKGWKHEFPFILAALGGVTVYFLFENTAVALTYASNVGMICGTVPLFVAATFWIVYKERPTKWFFIGGILAVFGVFCVAQNGAVMNMSLLGDFLAVMACVAWCFYTIAMRKIKSMPGEKDDIAITRRIFFWGALSSCLIIPFSGTADFLRVGTSLDIWLSFEVLGPLIYLAIFASCLCYVFNGYALRTLGEVSASAYIYTIPAISLLTAVIVVAEPVTIFAVIGLIAITLGLLISEEFWKRKTKDTPKDIPKEQNTVQAQEQSIAHK